ncbi:Coiled-coil domain-containing protein [Rhynchospora pubera]|uniref:Splicing factor YJU2 n=1 Tax=Rhynchospora pubera TaxID=906938 RepID=A0AAV8C5C4_9POAL|nr:Coiled-coil domain-containing protein [Rhynchospora pubera]
MGERKVLNKYYPPDFDPAKIPRRRQPKNQQMKVRMMLPMSIRCGTCGNYIYKGTKFNSRKEDVVGETYLGIQIFRFYFKCTKCSAEITFKTDPQNSDYTVESGASRNFEPWRDQDEAAENEKRKRDAEEMGDAMKSLENKALDSKKDMDILAALEEMRSMKSRHATVSFEDMLETLKRSSQQKEENASEELDEQDEALIKSIVFHNSKDYVRRIEEDDDDDEDLDMEAAGPSSLPVPMKPKSSSLGKPTDTLTSASTSDNSKSAGTRAGSTIIMPKFVLKPKATDDSSKRMRLDPTSNSESVTKVEIENKKPAEENSNTAPNGLQALCATYESDESE